MRAAIVRAHHEPVAIEDVELDDPLAHEVVVRTVAAGLCHSDLGAIDGSVLVYPLPLVLGHESAGIVEEVGSAVSYVKPGDHVVTTLGTFCGHCEYCLTGRSFFCNKEGVLRDLSDPPRVSQDGVRLTQYADLGSFAERILVHENSVAKIPKEMPLDRAALLGCGITTGLGAAINTASVRPGSTVAVIGCGGVGLSVVQGARLCGARRIIAIDPSPGRRDFAVQLGATDVLDPAEGNAVAQVQGLVGEGVDFAFEAVGSKVTSEQAFEMLRRGGLAVVVGVVFDTRVELNGTGLMRQCSITGSAGGSSRFRLDVPMYVDYYLQGRLLLDELVTSHITLDQVNAGLDAIRNAEGARTVMVFD